MSDLLFIPIFYGFYYFLTDRGLIYTCGFDNLTPSLPPIVGIYDI